MTNQSVNHAENKITFAYTTVKNISISKKKTDHMLESNVNVRDA